MQTDFLAIRGSYLEHYKTKGAKNGVRRFQSYEVAPNPSGFTGQEVGEAAEQRQRLSRKEQNKYDYKSSDSYKNASSSQRRAMTNTHNANEFAFGRKAANRIDYIRDTDGKEAAQKASQRQAIKQIAIGAAVSIAIPIALDVASRKMSDIQKMKYNTEFATSVTSDLANFNGLKTVSAKEVGKKPFASIKDQISYAKKGAQARDAFINSNYYKKRYSSADYAREAFRNRFYR